MPTTPAREHIRTRLLRHVATGTVSAHDQLDAREILKTGEYEAVADEELVEVRNTTSHQRAAIPAGTAAFEIYRGISEIVK